MRITNKDLTRIAGSLERFMGMPKGMEFEIRGAYGKVGLTTPDGGENITGLMSKRELYDTMRAMKEGMRLYKDRVKEKAKYKKRMR